MPPQKEAQILAMRSAGHMYSTIAIDCAVSESTIKRVCLKHGVRKGDLSHELGKAVQHPIISACASLERLTLATTATR